MSIRLQRSIFIPLIIIIIYLIISIETLSRDLDRKKNKSWEKKKWNQFSSLIDRFFARSEIRKVRNDNRS